MNLVLIFSLMFTLSAFAGCRENQSGNESSLMANVEKKVIIPIEGMSCMSCVANVKKTLLGIDGVKEVKVSLQDKNARIKYDTQKVSPKELAEAINKLGYKAGEPKELTE